MKGHTDGITWFLGPGSMNAVGMIHPLRTFFCLLFLLLAGAAPAAGAEDEKTAELLDLPLERLLDVIVVSASRKSQALSDVSSAVFVISQDDIRHSGATTIPDLLRMVPGVQVASIDGTSWAVSIRGFNGTFANKLLVMIDGRTVYTPLHGGVFWDVQDTLLENIERIEVIRGSGSTMWGANAVNGVINIITRNAQDTIGGLLTGITGTRERGTVGARYGAAIGDAASYRLYLKHVYRGDTHATSGSADDSLQITRGGFRFDSAPGNDLNLTLQGDLYSGSAEHSYSSPTFTPPFSATSSQPTDLFGANLISRLDWLQSESSKLSLQLYYDRTGRDTAAISEDRDTADLDLQHNLRFGAIHEITWGTGYRFLHDRTLGTRAFSLAPENRSDHMLNLFVQDEITLVQDKLRVILGTKLERNRFTGWEWEPSARISWTPLRGYSLWASVTRSVRTPTRGEQDVRIEVAVLPPAPPVPLPALVVVSGSREVESESLLAYELGFRADLSDTLSMDISSFHNRYQDLIAAKTGAPFVQGGTHLVIPSVMTNLGDYKSLGGEVSLQWQLLEWWKLKGGYAYLRFLGDDVENSPAAKGSPAHQATIRSMLALGRKVDFDLWARYVGDNSYPQRVGAVTLDIPAYVTMDARVAWRPRAGVEISLVGQNLLEQRHLETVSDMSLVKHEVERTVYGKVTWAF